VFDHNQGCITAFQTPSRGRGGREAVKAAWFYAASRVKKQAVLIKKNLFVKIYLLRKQQVIKNTAKFDRI
jgi:hypothetical protein